MAIYIYIYIFLIFFSPRTFFGPRRSSCRKRRTRTRSRATRARHRRAPGSRRRQDVRPFPTGELPYTAARAVQRVRPGRLRVIGFRLSVTRGIVAFSVRRRPPARRESIERIWRGLKFLKKKKQYKRIRHSTIFQPRRRASIGRTMANLSTSDQSIDSVRKMTLVHGTRASLCVYRRDTCLTFDPSGFRELGTRRYRTSTALDFVRVV